MRKELLFQTNVVFSLLAPVVCGSQKSVKYLVVLSSQQVSVAPMHAANSIAIVAGLQANLPGVLANNFLAISIDTLAGGFPVSFMSVPAEGKIQRRPDLIGRNKTVYIHRPHGHLYRKY